MKVLLATDGSVHSEAALSTILSRQWPSGTLFKVLHVVEPYFNWDRYAHRFDDAHAMFVADSQTMGNDYTRQMKEKFGDANVSSDIVQGKPGELLQPHSKIVEHANAWPADLIIIGSHGTTQEPSGSQLGRVARSVISTAQCSVEVVRGLSLAALAKKAAQKVELAETKFLLAVHTAEQGQQMIDAILLRDWPAASQFQIVHVVEPMHKQGIFHRMSAAVKDSAKQAQAHDVEQGEQMVKALASRLRTKVKHVSEHVLQGNPRNLILQLAQDWPADMIFIGSHSDRGAGDYWVGSVTDAVVAFAPCNVEIVKLKLPVAAGRK